MTSLLDAIISEARTLLSPSLVPLRALIVTMVGTAGAWLWYQGSPPLALALSAGPILLAYLLLFVGSRLLPYHPRVGLGLMEGWILAPLVLAVVATAATVLFAVHLAVPDGADPLYKESIGTISSALAAFFSSSFVAWTEDRDASTVSNRLRTEFWRRFRREGDDVNPPVRIVAPGSRTERLVYSDSFEGIRGWGLGARWQRATGISEELGAET